MRRGCLAIVVILGTIVVSGGVGAGLLAMVYKETPAVGAAGATAGTYVASASLAVLILLWRGGLCKKECPKCNDGGACEELHPCDDAVGEI